MYNHKATHWPQTERKWWVMLLVLLTAILYAARMVMPVSASAMAEEFGWNKADLGGAMGSFYWGYLTTQVVGGYVADKFGGDKVLCVSVFMWGTLTTITPHIARFRFEYASPLALLTILRILLGVSQGVHYPSMMSLLGKKIPETERSFPNGIVGSASQFGTVICGFIGSIILERHSWDDLFYAVGVIALCSVCSFAYFLHSTDNMTYKSHANGSSSKQKLLLGENIASVPWRVIFRKSPVWCLIFTHVCVCNFGFTILSWLPTYFHENFPNENSWLYNTVPYFMSIPASISSGWLGDRLINAKYNVGFIRKLMQTISLCGSAFFIVLLPFASSFYLSVLCAGLSMCMSSFQHAGAFCNAQDIAPSYAGSVFGVMNTFGAIPGFVGVYVAGHILDITKSWTLVFLIMGAVNCLGAVVFAVGGTGKQLV
ncbi:unnamed protein product [Clavelina lepadiformis]|uniref:Major facilitator superfamily (MFS) profile domain-containing protein n=1 Tax=Clavelina lepadiformis TaxID=159417 RepID=A0ABP0F278_CLALP